MSPTASPAPLQSAATPDPVALIHALYTAFAAKDTPAVLALLHPDVLWQQAAGFPSARGTIHRGSRAVLDNVLAPFREHWSDWSATLDRVVLLPPTSPAAAPSADGNPTATEVLALGRYAGTHRATGRSVVAPFACIYHVHGPHITRFIQHTDTALLARAAGVA